MIIANGVFHLFSTAITDFKRNKIRTLLTSLGIMIGVLSVVMLIALGLGLKNYIQSQFEGLGTNLVIVFPGSSLSEGGIESMMSGFMGGVEFDEKDVTNLEKNSLLDYVVPVFFKSTVVKANKEKELGYIFGTNEEIFSLINAKLISGSFFSESDLRRRAKKTVLGYTIAEKLFGDPEAAVGSIIEFNDLRFPVVGVIEKKGDREMDASVFMPYKTTFGAINPNKTFFAIYLGVASEDDISRAKNKVEQTLTRRYDEDEFSVTEQAEMLSAINEIFTMINSVLIAIGSISLLVGGIGIMNIMYATVTERTKEIGIRRAIGATKKDILLQFLTESVVLSLAGGIMGLGLAVAIVLGIQKFFPAAINLLSVIIALAVSITIGVFFGVFPARRAAKLSPIEAIRYE